MWGELWVASTTEDGLPLRAPELSLICWAARRFGIEIETMLGDGVDLDAAALMRAAEHYEIWIEGHINATFAALIPAAARRHGRHTIIEAAVDQPDLYRLLLRLGELSLPIVAVRRGSAWSADPYEPGEPRGRGRHPYAIRVAGRVAAAELKASSRCTVDPVDGDSLITATLDQAGLIAVLPGLERLGARLLSLQLSYGLVPRADNAPVTATRAGAGNLPQASFSSVTAPPRARLRRRRPATAGAARPGSRGGVDTRPAGSAVAAHGRAVAPDQRVRRAVVREVGLRPRFELGAIRCASTLPSSTPHWSNESMFQIDALREDAVLVERDQLAEHRRRQPLGEDRVRRPVALEDAVRHQPVRRALGPHLLGRLAERQRLGLGEHVGHQHVVVSAERVQRLRRSR